MKQILLLNTGGTFSSRPGAGGPAPGLSGAEISALLGGVPFLKGEFTAEIRRASLSGLPKQPLSVGEEKNT